MFRPLWCLVSLLCLTSAWGLALGHAAMGCDQTRCQTAHDVIPRLDLPATLTSIRPGAWSDPDTWDHARLPVATDRVQIQHAVRYDAPDGQAGIIGISTASGSLIFDATRHTRLTVETIMVLMQGQLIRHDGPGLTEILFRDTPLDTTNDPEQYSHGLIVIDGTVVLHGTPLTPYVRLAAAISAGASSVQVASAPAGWHPGHTIVVPDSRHLRDSERGTRYQAQQEERTIGTQAGTLLTLTEPLAYSHPGAHDYQGHLDFLPHVVNLTRTMVLRSANPLGTRGHILMTGQSAVTLQYVSLEGLGRTTTERLNNTTYNPDSTIAHIGTNQIGRYALHLHHVRHPVTLVGNVLQHTKKWGITLHDTHYSTITDNIVYDTQGWGIGNEQGNESFNVIQRNFVLYVRGPGGRGDGRGAPAGPYSPAEYGYEGSCFWLRGVNNYFDDNICANAMDAFGVFIFNAGGLSAAHVPTAPGADTNAPGGYVLTNMARTAPLSFSGLEVYGSQGGLSVWDLGANCCTVIFADAPLSTLRDTRLWHISGYGMYGYGMSNVVIDGWVQRRDAQLLTNVNEPATGLWWGDYLVRKMVIRHADIQGVRNAIISPYKAGDLRDAFGHVPGELLVQDSVLSATRCLEHGTMYGVTGGGSNLPPRRVTLDNVVCVKPPTVNTTHIVMRYLPATTNPHLLQKDEVIVKNYQQQPGVDFQVYYREQRPDFVVPQSSGGLVGAPVAGLTNAQLWEQYGMAIAGAIAPCLTTIPGVSGFVCPSTGPVLRAPTNLRILP